MQDPSTIEKEVSTQYLIFAVLWTSQLIALLCFALISKVVLSPAEPPKPALFWGLTGLAILLVLVSILARQKYHARAVEAENSVQALAGIKLGYIFPWALCEVAGLFGLLARAFTGSAYFYLLFIIAGLGMLLHFPKREQLMAASFKNRI